MPAVVRPSTSVVSWLVRARTSVSVSRLKAPGSIVS